MTMRRSLSRDSRLHADGPSASRRETPVTSSSLSLLVLGLRGFSRGRLPCWCCFRLRPGWVVPSLSGGPQRVNQRQEDSREGAGQAGRLSGPQVGSRTQRGPEAAQLSGPGLWGSPWGGGRPAWHRWSRGCPRPKGSRSLNPTVPDTREGPWLCCRGRLGSEWCRDQGLGAREWVRGSRWQSGVLGREWQCCLGHRCTPRAFSVRALETDGQAGPALSELPVPGPGVRERCPRRPGPVSGVLGSSALLMVGPGRAGGFCLSLCRAWHRAQGGQSGNAEWARARVGEWAGGRTDERTFA